MMWVAVGFPWCEVTRAACSFSGQVNLGLGGCRLTGTASVRVWCPEYVFLCFLPGRTAVQPQNPRASGSVSFLALAVGSEIWDLFVGERNQQGRGGVTCV